MSNYKTPTDVLSDCSIDGNIVRLPGVQLDRKLYQEVAKQLDLIGGKWKSGKVQGFVFSADPSTLMEQLKSGGNNLKKEFQFFGTDDVTADWLVELSEMKATSRVLEPSAGQGAIVKAIHRAFPDHKVDYCELMDINRTFMKEIKNSKMVCEDFLELPASKKYDRIISNPPFSQNQDIIHILKMYEHLKPGGRLVSVSSRHWKISSGKKEDAFKEWVEKTGAEVLELKVGTFRGSGTMVGSFVIVVNK